MKRKFWAFSITLVLMLLILLGPRHPGGDLRFHPSLGFYRASGTVLRSVRDGEGTVANWSGIKVRLGAWNGPCGLQLSFEDQVNCTLYFLNHPEEWPER